MYSSHCADCRASRWPHSAREDWDCGLIANAGCYRQPKSEEAKLIAEGEWVVACAAGALEPEAALRFDHGGRTFVIVRSPDGAYYAIDGHCSHEKVHLGDGIVDGHIIECPKHFGAFDYRTGEARALPACIDLRVYEVKVEGDSVFVKI
ncbi:Rieske 2Fe-2S domain-containing protein [Bradyrhizobium sp. IC4060]|nr:Rieske 2Fe-2S domain-containing protein [Bradyrhizobium sp. IC4060]MCA1488781.1 Rieske 2Fe-2S domain-containing protein [Bradyrhizobium sp. IC4061]